MPEVQRIIESKVLSANNAHYFLYQIKPEKLTEGLFSVSAQVHLFLLHMHYPLSATTKVSKCKIRA